MRVNCASSNLHDENHLGPCCTNDLFLFHDSFFHMQWDLWALCVCGLPCISSWSSGHDALPCVAGQPWSPQRIWMWNLELPSRNWEHEAHHSNVQLFPEMQRKQFITLDKYYVRLLQGISTSATERRLLWNFNLFTPCLTGFPWVFPLGTFLLRPPRRIRTR